MHNWKKSMERQIVEHGFGPFYRKDSHILFLGSFPSVKSREQGFFYGHPQNRFWRVLAAVFEGEVPVTLPEKERFLEEHGIALYDVIERCSIIGSSDSSIRDVVPADLRKIIAESDIEDRIFTNGKTAFRLYGKYQEPILLRKAVSLPSTSPANAAMSLDRLVQVWRDNILPLR